MPQSLKGTVRRRPGPEGIGWARLGVEASISLEQASHPERPKRVVELATREGVSAAYLRRAIALVPLLADRRFAKLALGSMPIAAVEIIRRWARYDPAEASEAAGDFLSLGLSTPQLAERELRARRDRGKLSGESSRVFRKRLQTWVEREFSAYRIDTTEDRQDSLIRLHSAEADDAKKIAVIAIGPYADPALEKKRARDVTLQALGLLHYNDEVLLVCSSSKASEYAQEFLDNHNIRTAKIDIKTAKDLSL